MFYAETGFHVTPVSGFEWVGLEYFSRVLGTPICTSEGSGIGTPLVQIRGYGEAYDSASERRGNNLKEFKDFHLKAKAGIWP